MVVQQNGTHQQTTLLLKCLILLFTSVFRGSVFFCCWNAVDWLIPCWARHVRCAIEPLHILVLGACLDTCEPSIGTVLMLYKYGQVSIMKNSFNANFFYCRRYLWASATASSAHTTILPLFRAKHQDSYRKSVVEWKCRTECGTDNLRNGNSI